jgi:hypothetical protein
MIRYTVYVYIGVIVGNKLGKPLVGEPKMKIVYTIMTDLKQIGFENEMWEKVTHFCFWRCGLRYQR